MKFLVVFILCSVVAYVYAYTLESVDVNPSVDNAEREAERAKRFILRRRRLRIG